MDTLDRDFPNEVADLTAGVMQWLIDKEATPIHSFFACVSILEFLHDSDALEGAPQFMRDAITGLSASLQYADQQATDDGDSEIPLLCEHCSKEGLESKGEVIRARWRRSDGTVDAHVAWICRACMDASAFEYVPID